MTTPYSFLHNIRSWLNPVLKESKFLETGVLTPAEFVAAGDFLTFKCPTWGWAPAPHKQVDYLPPDKQYLVTRGVPCVKRVKDLFQIGEFDQDGVIEIVDHGRPTSEIPDMEDFDEIQEDDDPAANDKVLKTRTYTLYITYDKVYQTPRLWLYGFSEENVPLTPDETFEDISEEHAKKTITLEPFLHEPQLSILSIHPCQHASLMKKLLSTYGSEITVERYLVVFLKFVSSIIPGIEYDYTM